MISYRWDSIFKSPENAGIWRPSPNSIFSSTIGHEKKFPLITLKNPWLYYLLFLVHIFKNSKTYFIGFRMQVSDKAPLNNQFWFKRTFQESSWDWFLLVIFKCTRQLILCGSLFIFLLWELFEVDRHFLPRWQHAFLLLIFGLDMAEHRCAKELPILLILNLGWQTEF